MRKLLALTLSAPLFFAASSAFAADDSDHTGGYALGVASSLSGTPGLSARFFVNQKLGVEAVVSHTASSPKEGSESSALDWSAIAEYRLASTNNVAFSGYAGFGTGSASEEIELGGVSVVAKSDTSTLGAGVKAEYFFARGFSVFGRTGLSLVTVKDEDGNEVRTETNLFDNSNLLGAMGFSVWFK